MNDIFRAFGESAEFRPMSELKPYGRNARRHTKKQIAKLADAIATTGWGASVLVDEAGMILAGHGRVEAAKTLGLAQVPVEVRSGLTDSEKRALILADNRLHDESTFDMSVLKLELADLSLSGFSLEKAGFDTLEVDRILTLDEEDPGKDEEVVDLPDDDAASVSRAGDCWHIDQHRIYHGDARFQSSYDALLAGEKARLVFSDPPYGCAIEGNVSGLGKVRHKNFVMGAGETSLEEFARGILLPAFECMAASTLPGTLAYIFTDWRASPYLHEMAEKVFAEQKNLIVWAKTNAGMGTCYRSAHELIHLYKVSAGKHINTFGLGGKNGRHRSNVWVYPGANTFRKGRMEDLAAHSTVKPRKLVEDAIVDASRRGDIVLDPFLGSGTTIAAAHTMGRRGFGIELDGKYVDVAIERLTRLVGKPALLDGTTPFEEVARLRRAEGGAA